MNMYQKIYMIVEKIPPGKVMTYSQIATILGNPRLARRVGQAVSAAPKYLDLPCHRIVKIDGSLPVTKSFDNRQKELLLSEGVVFDQDGKVCLDQSLFYF